MSRKKRSAEARLLRKPTALPRTPTSKNLDKVRGALLKLYTLSLGSPYLRALSEESASNLSSRLAKDSRRFIDWAKLQDPGLSFEGALTRWALRERLQVPENNKKTSGQVSPLLSIAAELIGRVERYADKLDRHVHLCFTLYAEGLDEQEISAITHFPREHVDLYIRSAKEMIKDHLKSLMVAS